jgi:hypothetical protein
MDGSDAELVRALSGYIMERRRMVGVDEWLSYVLISGVYMLWYVTIVPWWLLGFICSLAVLFNGIGYYSLWELQSGFDRILLRVVTRAQED